MNDALEELIAKARLAPTAPYTAADVEAAHQRVVAKIAARHTPPEPPAPRTPTADVLARQRADQQLHMLCTVLVSAPTAIEDLVAFVGDSLPGPVGGRVLGSILYLRARPDSARFWWQYAAGSGDQAAMYCLYLYHQAIGEPAEAEVWSEQLQMSYPTPPATPTADRPNAPIWRLDAHSRRLFERMNLDDRPISVFQALRILRALRTKWSLADDLTSVMNYVPMAVAWIDPDLELPMPDWDFVSRIKSLAARTAPPRYHPKPAEPLVKRPKIEGSAAVSTP